MQSASVAALAAIITTASPTHAQLAARRGATAGAPAVAPRAIPGQGRTPAATDALNRSIATKTRAEQIRAYATQARAAVARSVPDGLQGLVVATGVTPEALAAGALQAARDSTGRVTWQGAALPVETTNGDAKLVTITQTDSRAILSWNQFDVGSKTTLVFDQKVGGIGQKDWVAVNRVVDPTAAPSQILGQIKADGTVVVINRNGVIFGNGAQVSANSLLASSLDIGNFLKVDGPRLMGTTLQERNIAFLQNGLLQNGVSTMPGYLTSALVEGSYDPQPDLIDAALLDGEPEGDVVVERGATITAGKGGFVILTGPNVSNDGTLKADEGQVSLQAGQAISATVSTGAANSADPNIRGLILRTQFGGAGSSAVNTGLIETKRGYASLGAGLAGSVTNGGLIAATTSVSRNGSITLTAGTVTLSGADEEAKAGGLVITPDDNGETIPQGTAAAPPAFKQSQIQIGGIYVNPFGGASNALGELGPANVTIGANALVLAPNANVAIGGKAGEVFLTNRFTGGVILDAAAALAASRIDIAAGALIDVSGVKDVKLDASRNSLKIAPVKRNELRDTPNYREINTNGEFTLNGETVYVDPRITGVRDDGVAYVGSPLIEAGSAASQIGVTAAELMTEGGMVSLNVAVLPDQTQGAAVPYIVMSSGATIDFSGGWVTYADGIVRTSRLLAADGQIVDIGVADPNGQYVAVGDGFTEVQAKFGISTTYNSSILQGERFEFGYDEGRDAGGLIIGASSATIDGTLHGDAFAGARQLANARRPSAQSAIVGDLRKVQSRASELPSGGYLRVGAFGGLAGDIFVGDGDAPAGAIRLDDSMLSTAGLSALSLRTSAGVEIAAGSSLELAKGGSLSIEAGRTILFDGDVSAPSGSISAKTIDFGKDIRGASQESLGSPFRTDDDLAGHYDNDPGLQPFDIIVNGTLSTAGLWVNDFLDGNSFTGSAWGDGGSISLTVAPRAFVGVGGTSAAPTSAADRSGSIRIAGSALLDVSSGGYVAPDGTLDLTARGGDVSLINETVYASTVLTDTDTTVNTAAKFPIGGRNQTVGFTPYPVGETEVVPSLVPDILRAEVSFEASSIKGFGFGGGGTFRLVAPDIAMGSEPGAKGPRIGLDFLQTTGFGTLDLTAVKSRIVSNLFANGTTGNSAFLETERFVVGDGETLDLTQTVLPSLLDLATLTQLTALATGADIKTILSPIIPADAWDRKAAHLKLGGLTELEVAEGGSIVGAAGASITIPRLYSAGTIRIAGGRIEQIDTLESILAQDRVVGVLDVSLGGGGLSDVLGGGVAGQENGFDEDALAQVDVFRDPQQTQRLTNGELFSLVDPAASGRNLDVNLVFTGRVALNEGVHLTSTSVTDLSGTALYDPRAPFLANGQQLQLGRMIGGGSITTSNRGAPLAATGYASPIDPSSKLVAEANAVINLDGASGAFDERISQREFGRVAQWSDAGRLTIGNGAQLTGAVLTAFGGDDGDADPSRTRATGGILDWVAPVIRQEDDGSVTDGSALFASQIMDAGFDSLIARNGFTTVGDVDLILGKSFIATTDTVSGQRTANNLLISAAPGSNASIFAPYIRLASSNKDIGGVGNSSGPGSISLVADAIDVVGAVEFNVSSRTDGANRGSVSLEATGDIRLIGTAGLPNITTGLFQPGLSGQLVSNGDLTLKAAQVYATTGTGDLQQLLEDRRAGRTGTPNPFIVASTNVDGIVRLEGQGGTLPATPYSAGSYLAIRGAHIEQNGVLRAPLGLLDIGSNDVTPTGGSVNAPATLTLSFGPDSLTSVSARTGAGDEALDIPYGTTTDLIEYFFAPGTNAVLTTVPVGELRFAGAEITIGTVDAPNELRIDGRGGGGVFAFEFVPGTGGSRDLLDRLNPDVFSGNDGLQFPDGRQVYAILPKNSATAAMFDPIYSADYAGGGGVDLYGIDAGLSVHLDAAPGIAAGEYLLLPAHYALLPGAMRVVENVGADAPYADGAVTLLDGSIVVGGVYATAGTGLSESQRRSFTVQSQEVIAKYSRIETTSGSENTEELAEHKGVSVPHLPRDAARVVLAPLTSLQVFGAFATDAAEDGLGAQVDVGGSHIRIAAAGAVPEADTAGYVLLTTDTLANFNANSLSIGALRTDNADGTTTLDVVTKTLRIDNDVIFSAPELLFTVGGPGSLLTIEDAPIGGIGAHLTATGTLADSRTGDYIINATAAPDGLPRTIDPTGSGALLRLAAGPERLVSREGDFAIRNTLVPARLDIGRGTTLGAAAITLDSSRIFAIDRTAHIGAATPGGNFTLAVSGDALRIGGLTFHTDIETQFGLASSLTYRSPDVLNFMPGTYRYKNLTIDAPGIGSIVTGTTATNNVELVADNVTLRNSSMDLGACKNAGSRICGENATLAVDAATITFGSGTFRTYGFYGGPDTAGVTLAASEGMYITGKGQFNVVNDVDTDGIELDTPLNLITPFIIDRTTQGDIRNGYVRPDYAFSTLGAINVTGPATVATLPSGGEAPGARISFNSGGDTTIDNAIVRATAGTVDVKAAGSILLVGSASIQTPGYTKTFDDGLEKTIVSASGGVINLITTGLGTVIDTSETSSLIVDNGVGEAGILNIAASQGEVNLRSLLNPGVAAGIERSSSLFLDAGYSLFDFAGFVTTYGSLFQGDIAIRTGSGDLSLLEGQELVADSVSLTADGGIVSIAGTVDTSGDDVSNMKLTDPRYKEARIDGGDISLFGQNGVTLASTASLISTTSGYGDGDARRASGGNVTIGIGIPEAPGTDAAISIAEGATINVSALRPGDRLIGEIVTDPATQLETPVYRLAQSDRGGLVSFRAPVLNGNMVNIDNDGSITGARELSVEGYRRFDLDLLAGNGAFSGVTLGSQFGIDFIALDPGQHVVGKDNFLADNASGTLPDFIRNFSITDANGEAFDGYRVRPGVELNSDIDIRLQNNWNLGAGQIVNADGSPGYADALAAGLLVASPLGGYEVVAGKEAELFENFVDMTYRVDGDVRGEAPVLTLRSAGNLEIRNSISDGFFAFHDLTNPDFINYQLGGGDRVYSPALLISCGADANCSDTIPFDEAPTGPVAGPPGTRVTIVIGTALQGAASLPFVNAPYNPLANAASAGGTGDPLGVAELFPLLSDGSAVHSSSMKLVGGAMSGSANPLQIDVSSAGSVIVSGEKSFEITGTPGVARLAGLLQLAFGPVAGRDFFNLDDLLASIDSGADPNFDANYYTVINWGAGATGAAGAARAAALAYPAFQHFLGPSGNRTGVAAPLRDVIAFLNESGFAETFSQGVQQQLPGFPAVANLLAPTSRLQSHTAFVGTEVRTGDGTIDVAAAKNIDLRRTQGVVSRQDPLAAQDKAQVGGTAIYTAGVRASLADLAGGQLPAFVNAPTFIPGPTSGVTIAPVFTKNGGAISLTAGQDILGRRDVWNELFGQNGSRLIGGSGGSTATSTIIPAGFGTNSDSQRWRYGMTSLTNTQSAIAPNFFTSGVGALGGGDVSIRAGRDVSDLTIALDNSLVTGQIDGVQTLVTLGGGDLSLVAGRNLAGGQFDIASGAAVALIGGDVVAAGTVSNPRAFVEDNRNLLRVRVSDATFELAAKGNVTIGGLGALGPGEAGETGVEAAGFFSSIAGVAVNATGDIAIVGNRPDQFIQEARERRSQVLPPSLALISFNGDLAFGSSGETRLPKVLAPSQYGQLSLLAGGDIAGFALAMSDAAPVNFFGQISALTAAFPTLLSTTSDSDLRRLHNRHVTHLDDPEPVRIVAGGSIEDVVLSLPKQARIRADKDIVDLVFQGQNVRPGDVTRISAGRDITGTTGVSTESDTQGRSGVLGNSITLGGPGALIVEAGRDLGPFITSATGSARSEAGGIRTIGNEANPWLSSEGADLYVLFGVGKGVDYAALQSVYLDPANLAQLDGDLFVQIEGELGTSSPDRTRFTYAPVLAEWLRDNAPEQFAAVFGATPPTGDALKEQAFARYDELYAHFAELDQVARNRFLIDKVYFSELAAPSDPNSASFNQFIRGYRAVQTLFPASLGYTDNLATYETDPDTINADHPLGVPVKKLVNGEPAVADVVNTGNVDLRLATLETTRGGDITILGPGGNFIAGSVVRTEAQIKRRVTAFNVNRDPLPTDLTSGTYYAGLGSLGLIRAIPPGFEGILTLRGGEVRGFTDGGFILNQSRLFTQSGGDITLWSSNGDLNAGQGPRSSSNFPPIVVRFSPNGFSEVDSAGSVSGAGIGAFQPSPDVDPSSVRLIAPVGTVDAGDAGVRASGSLFVAAARVANADSFSAGGDISGVPSLAATAAPPTPASAASAMAANAFNAANAVGDGTSPSRIFVDVLGFLGTGTPCPEGQTPNADGECQAN